MAEFVTRKQREKAQAKTEYNVPDMCSFALHRGKYCTGDTQKPGTHAPECPHYVAMDPFCD